MAHHEAQPTAIESVLELLSEHGLGAIVAGTAVAGATYGGTNVKPTTGGPPRAQAGGGDSHAWWAVWRNW